MLDSGKDIVDLSPEKLELLEMLIQEDGDELICCPMSYGQQRLWFLDQLEPGNPVYNQPTGVRLRGALQLSALERSLNQIIRRHEALRTRFLTVDGEPVQVIDPELELPLEVVDLSALSEDERETESLRLGHATAACGFNLTTGPLLRTTLLRLSAEEHILLLIMHHIISDGWSLGVLVREVGALYRAFTEGLASPLPELPIQYADYALWQREQLTNEFLAEQLSYWREQLSGASAVLELPTDHVRPAVKRYRGARERLELSAELTAALKTLSREQGVTLFMVLLAAFKVLLWRYTGQADVVVGTPIANRQQSEIEGLIGFFVNTLALRTSIQGSESFKDLLKRVREICLGAYQHQDVPFEMVVEEMAVERAMGQTPLFQVMFVMQAEAPAVVEMKGLQVSVLEMESGTAKFDLTMMVREDERRLRGQVEYDTDLFEAGSIKRLVGHYQQLLQELVRDGEQAIAAVSLLGVEERQQLLFEWNQTSAPTPDRCLHQLFEAQVERTPDAVAVVFEGQQLSYGELNRRANQLAHYLRRLGVGPEVLVGVYLERSVEMIVALLGILKAGGAFVPLDPTYPQERIAFMLADAGVAVLLTQRDLRAKFGQSGVRVVCLEEEWSLIRQGSIENLAGRSLPGQLAYVIYTSGSSGLPKGVAIEHGSLSNYLCWVNESLFAGSSYNLPFVTGLFFDASLKQVFAPLVRGDQVWLLSNDTVSDPSALLAALNTRSNVALNCVPSLWAALLKSVPQGEIANRINSLRGLFVGGESLSRELLDRTFVELPQLEVWNLYGPTESTANAVFSRITPGKKPLIGRPIANTEAYVLDADLQPVPIGVVGELYIGGVGLARGYLGRPELTAERFVPHPFSGQPGERLYRTGDLACFREDGQLEYQGRIDQQVKVRGFRIELGEIEAVLSEHPLVRQSVTIAREDVTGDKRLVSYIVVAEPVESGELRRHLKQQLPDYMIPSAFVLLDVLPLMPNGKIDRRALPAPEPARIEHQASTTTQTPIEEIITGICGHLLKCEEVSGADNFFELGGHSLLATQLIARLRDSLALEIPVRWVFQSSTLAELAEMVETEFAKEKAAAGPRIAAIRHRGETGGDSLPLSFAQQRLWFLDQLEPGNPVYNIPGSVRLTGPLDLAAVSQSLNEIIKRHEALRTRFAIVDGQPVQVVEAALELAIEVLDLSAMSETEGEVEAHRLAMAAAALPFDLTTGPLLRATLLRLAAEEHMLLLTMHHIISDGWSLGVLVREVAALYQAFSRQLPSPLPELPVQYADFAICQRGWLQGEVLEEQLSYWREQLSGAPAVLGLSTDHVRPAVKKYRGAHERLELSAELTAALKTLSREQGVTLFMALLAAFKVLLWRYAGQAEVVVGTPIANRRQSEIEGLIGFFVNTLALRTRIAGNESFTNLLKRVREVCLGAYQHQDVPFEIVVEEMAVERALSHTPIFQVMFVLQNTPASELLLEDVEISVLAVESGTAKFDLLLNLEEKQGGGLEAVLEYDTDLYEQETAKRMLGHYQRVLEGVIQQSEACVGELPLLSEQERRQLLRQWNETEEAYPQLTLPELFERQVERTPERIAVEFGEEQVSYQQLNCRANQLAHYLRKLGVGPDAVVSIMMERSVETILSVLGVLKAGGAYMLLDPDYPSERCLFMLADSSAQVVLTRQSLSERLGEQKAQVLCLDADWASVAGESEENPVSGVMPDNLAYIIYTSGSTGRPKGVAMPQRPPVNLLAFQSHNFDASNAPRTLQFSSLSFDVSFQEIFSTFCAGATLVLIDEEVHRDARDLWQVLLEKGTERLFLPFVALQQLAEVVETEETVPLRLHEVITAGEQLKVTSEIRLMFEKLAGCTLENQYGPSETHVATAWQLPGTPHEWPHLPPIGKPITNTQIYVLDEWLQPVPIGVVGELYIGGECLARGYVDRPEQTAERFIPHPFSETGGERLYKTGDLARYLTNGCLDFVGRSDHQVKVRGFRIEIGEIEFALKQHPAVKQAIVHAWDDTTGQKRLAAYVVAAPEESLATAELRNHLREILPEYMIPSAFILLAELPLTPSGKVDRRALSAPDLLRSETEQSYAAPRTPIEEVLASIWANLLGLEQVGINDNFFELGGHSLLATRVISQIRDALQIDLAVRQLFEHSTIAELAQSIEKEMRGWQQSPQPLTLTTRPGAIPLSFAQQRLWFLDQMEPDSFFYNLSSALRLNGPLDHQALEQSFAEIIRRHEVLRTSFQMSGEEPVQVIASEPYFNLRAFDLSALPEAQREPEAQELAAAEAAQPFDLSALPLLRATLLCLSAEEHILLLTMHHIISDGWSLRLMVKEVATLYRAFKQNLPSPLPELEVQYADYALWQRQQLSGALLDEQLTYWREQLQNAPAVLNLPTDQPRPMVKRYRGAREILHISEELAAELKTLSRAQRVTMFMLLLAAWKVLMWRYSGQEDIVVGTPIANREESRIEDLIGFFVNTLAVRTHLKPTERFVDLVKRVREECLAAYQHQAVPFELVVEELAVERSLSYTPVFQVMFVLQNEPLVPREMEDIEITAMEIEGRTAKVDLLLAIEAQEAGGFRGVIEYDTDLFEHETVRRVAQHYQMLLQAVATKVDEQIDKLPLLGAEERQQILVTWNETKAEYPAQSVSELFETVVERTPEKAAVLFEEQRISYDDLNHMANQLGHHLRKLGVGPETVVAVLAERSVETIVSLLAVLKAGGAYLPLETSTPPERLLFIMEDCGVKLLLTQQRLLARLPAHRVPVVLLDADQHLISNESKQNLSAVGVTPEHLAYLMYTSGSTGKPKGIGIPHRGIVRLVCGANYANLSADEVILQAAPISFDAATFEIWGSLLNGGRLVLLPAERASLEELGRALKEHQVTTLWLTAGLFHLMVEERVEDLQGLRQLLAGGDVLSVSHVERALRELNGGQLINGYGPTENTTFTCCHPMTSMSQVGGTVSIGRPISNTKVYLLDANLQPVPIGVTGELYIGGDGLARGYFNQPSLTAEKFIPDPFNEESGGRLYRSGDLARYLCDGNIEFLGRLDHQVKIRGFRLEPGEIQTVLAEHPAVAQCVVLVRAGGERDKTLLAYVVAEEMVSVSELRTYLQPRLPEYMIPTSFVMLSAMPLTPNGKVDRSALLALESNQLDSTATYAGARTPVEEVLVGMWSNLLGVQRVGIYDNFFELGGHSLLAVRLLSRVRASFEVAVSLHSLFETPTVAGLADEVERRLRAGQTSLAMPIQPAQREGKLALSFAQQRLWFLNQLEPDSGAYNVPIALRLKGLLNVSAFELSLCEVVRRHECLRTTFVMSDGEPSQVVAPALAIFLPIEDLRALAETERKAEMQRLMIEEAHRPFDLARGPLLRAKLLRLAEDEHVALFTMHHIISDGWSMGVLVQEIATLYQSFMLEQPPLLPELPVQYADFAMSQREWLQGEVLKEQLSYWREQLSGAPAVIGLPTDHVRPAVKSYRGRSERFALSAELTAALKALSREQGVTLFMVLLAAFKVLLWRYSGQRDVVVGTPIANRQQSEIEGLIGFFVNTLALRTNIEGSESFRNLLKQVREVCLGAYQHQDVPFEMVVEELAVERALNHAPIFQVMFVLQNMPASELLLEDVEISVLEVESGTAKFDLLLTVREDEGRLRGQVEYDTDLFEAGSIKRLVGHYEKLLQELVRDGEQVVGAVPLLGAEERQQLLYDWNQTSAPVPGSCLHELFEAQVERTPDAVAVVFEGQQLSYGELNRRANQIAYFLRRAGVGAEARVGVLLARSVELLTGLLGILKAGGAYVPLDLNYPQERLSFMLEDAQAKVLLTQEGLRDRLPGWQGEIICVDSDWELIAAESSDDPVPLNVPGNIAYLIYTSGSTGRPKGVSIEHRNAVTLLHWAKDVYTPAEYAGVLAATSICFDLSVFEFFVPLSWGGKVIIAENALQLPQLPAAQAVTLVNTVPSAMAELVREGGLPGSVRVVNLAGEALKRSLVKAVYGLEGVEKVFNLYGPSEDTTYSTYVLVDDGDGDVSIGRPVANTRVYLLDEQLRPVPVGVRAELYLGGAGLARGYHRRPELTAERFVPDPFSGEPGARLYGTGDVARYLANGELDYLGRVDHQVKIRGFRVEVGEVETQLEQHEALKQAVVAARDAEAGGKQLVAYLVARQSEPPATAELRAFLKQRLPEYMVPGAFVFLSELPLTASGKINRSALPEPGRPELSDSYVGPRSEIEALVCSLWAGILKLERVGVYDNFFELGGHSLLATQVMSRVREAFGVEVALRELFERPTVKELGQSIERELRQGAGVAAPPITRVDREQELPLSFAQQRLWFIDQLEPGRTVYNIPVSLRLSGELNVMALEQALNEIISRHEALRTSFAIVDQQPVQIISPAVSLRLAVQDLSSWPEAEREAEAVRLTNAEAHQPFDLSQGPLLRVKLLRLEQSDHIVLLTMHHIITDGWSLGVLIKEVTVLYQGFSQGEPTPLPELPVQYADFAVWQRTQLQGEELERQLSYWRQQLADAPAILELPTDRPRPVLQTFNGAHQKFRLSAESTQALHKLSRSEDVTLFMTLLAVWQVLLCRYTGQQDVVVGADVANRNRAETEGLIGFFVNMLVLRTNLAGDPVFLELLKRVKDVCLGAYVHQDLPFEKLVEELQPERSLSHSPLFQVLFALQNAPMGALELPGLALSSVERERDEAQFDLILNMQEIEGELCGTLRYNTDLFEAATIQRMVGHLQTLLAAVVADPAQRLSTLPLLTAAEEQQLIEWNDTATDYPIHACVHQLFEAQVEQTPEAIALVYNDQQLTYRELNARANQLAHYLQSFGVGPEVGVGLCLERSPELIVALLAILKAGGAYVPLDSSYPLERLAFMLEDAQIGVLVTNEELLDSLPTHWSQVVCLDTDAELIASASEQNPSSEARAENLAYVMYTSGSTGQPKGVSVIHRSITRLVKQTNYIDVCESDVFLQSAPISFDASTLEVWASLLNGARLVLMEQQRPTLEELGKAIRKNGVTVLWLTTGLFHLMVEEQGEQLRSVRWLLAGGDVLPVEQVRKHLAGMDSECRLINGYGPTENTTFTCCHVLERNSSWKGSVPIGKPISNTEVYILDQQQQVVPVGVSGELYLGGDGLARGYLQRAELTAEKFVPHPFSEVGGERLYRTGDVGRWLSDGSIEYLGRKDEQVKIRGFRIELGEIETALSRHAAVREAVVVATTVNEDKRLVAYLVTEESLEAGELRQYLKGLLPEYMVPQAFVKLEQLPLTANGKVDRAKLPAVESWGGERSSITTSSQTPVEEMLAGIWSEVLGVAEVGVEEDFFELGGHSLLATQVMSRVREAFGVEVGLRELFERPTVAGLALSIESARMAEQELAPPVVRVSREEPLPLSFTQQRLWFLQQLDPESGAYNIPAGVRLTGSLDVKALERSFDEVVRRHESLRTSFPAEGGRVVQHIGPPVKFRLEASDITWLPEAKRESEVNRVMEDEARRPFDLGRGPLWRVRLLRLGEQEHILLYAMHHTISDEWSMGVLIQEVAALYKAFASGEESPLEELTVQYADYAVWQRDLLQGEVLDEHLSYWKGQLKGAPAVLDLPTDKPRSSMQTTRGAHVNLQLPAELTQQLRQLSRQEVATLFMTLLAAFEVLLHKYTGQQDIVVGTPVAGRDRREVEGLIGAFINALAIRVDLSGDPTFQELIRRVRSAVLGAFAHDEMPFEKLLEVLQPARQPGCAPLFQVVFNYLQPHDPVIELPNLSISFLEVNLEKAKYDLTLYIGEGRNGLSGNLTYKTDLFEAMTIERMVADFEKILIRVAAQPEARLSTIVARPNADFKTREPGSVRRKAIKLTPASLVRTSYLRPEGTFPLVVQPSIEELDLACWAQANGDFVEEELLKHGALLFRGFNMSSVEDFRRFAGTVTTDLVNYIEGSSERILLGDQVYTSSEYPAEYFISLHNELSYAHKWPGRIFFCCLQPPQQGGETPIADSRKVLNLISPQIKESFLRKGVKYVRNLRAGNGAGLSWQMVFEADDQAFVEGYCREGGIEFEWKQEGGLRTSQVRPAVARHPRTGEMVWFNQADQWHPSNLGGKLAAGLGTAMKEEDLPINAYYGDGSPFDLPTLDAIRRAYQEATVVFPWQKGDVMLLDNMLMAHGRMPFSGPRRVAVAMGAPVALKEIERAIGR